MPADVGGMGCLFSDESPDSWLVSVVGDGVFFDVLHRSTASVVDGCDCSALASGSLNVERHDNRMNRLYSVEYLWLWLIDLCCGRARLVLETVGKCEDRWRCDSGPLLLLLKRTEMRVRWLHVHPSPVSCMRDSPTSVLLIADSGILGFCCRSQRGLFLDLL